MFEPSVQMLSLVGGFERPPTSCKHRKSKFWETEGEGEVSESKEPTPAEKDEAAPSLTKEEIEKEIDRLKTRTMEVSLFVS